MAGLNQELLEVPLSPNYPVEAAKGRPTDLVPISPVVAKVYFQGLVVSDTTVLPATLVQLAFGCVSALHFLFCVGWTAEPILPDHYYPLSEAQELTLRRIFSSCRDLMQAEAAPLSLEEEQGHLNARRVSYWGGGR